MRLVFYKGQLWREGRDCDYYFEEGLRHESLVIRHNFLSSQVRVLDIGRRKWIEEEFNMLKAEDDLV